MRQLLAIALLLTCLPAFGQRYTQAFATITDLLASNPRTVNTNAVVLGRDSANDGGGGNFYYNATSSATTNKGTIFKPNSYSGRWFRVADPFEVNAAWFGAIPDDGLDDSVAIQAAMDYCYSQKRGTVHLNGGLYHLNSSLYAPHRVNLVGAHGWKFTELASITPTSPFYMLGGATQLRMMDGANLQAMLVMNSTDGYNRQPSEVLEDGSIVDSRFQETLIENIVFNGNSANNTAHTHGISAFSKWNMTVRNCGFILLRGNTMYWRDCNGLVVENIWMKGQIGQLHNSGMWVYSTADSIFKNFWAFGFQGPCIWVNGSTTGVNLFSDMLLGNSVVSNTIHTVTGVSSGQWTLSGSPWFETGDHVELRTTGSVPTGFSRVTLYYLYKIGSGVYGLHTNYNQATNGVYLTTVDSGTGTHYITKGPASAVYISGAANNNSFVNIRADQNSGPGFYFRDAYANAFTGGLISQNTGVDNFETIPAEDQVGVRFDLFAQQNSVVNTTIRFTPIGFQTTNGAYGNLMLGRYYFVTTQIDRQSNSANDEPVVSTGGYVSIGSNTNQAVLKLSGNASGVRLLQLYRDDISQQTELGVQADGLTVWNGTGGYSIGSFAASSSASTLKFGSSRSSPRTAILQAETATGTDVGAANFQFFGSSGTGNSTSGGNFQFYTPDATSSGTSVQGITKKLELFRTGQIGVYSTSSDPTLSLSAGQIFHRSDTGQFRGYTASKWYDLAASLSGSTTWDIASLGTLANGSTALTVTGAAVGDLVVVSPAMPATGVVVSGDVTSADTVTLRAHNTTSGSVDPASTTFRVRVIKQ